MRRRRASRFEGRTTGRDSKEYTPSVDDPKTGQLLEAMRNPRFMAALAGMADNESSPSYPFSDFGKRLWRRTNTKAGTIWVLDEYWAKAA